MFLVKCCVFRLIFVGDVRRCVFQGCVRRFPSMVTCSVHKSKVYSKERCRTVMSVAKYCVRGCVWVAMCGVNVCAREIVWCSIIVSLYLFFGGMKNPIIIVCG